MGLDSEETKGSGSSAANSRRDDLMLARSSTVIDDSIVTRPVRFRIFVQPPMVEGFEDPETVAIPLPEGGIAPGPTDMRFRTVMPAEAKSRYLPPHSHPPYTGITHPEAVPNSEGHFDTIPIETAQFKAAHVYVIARVTLNIWQRYFGFEIPWAFHHTQMELVPEIDWENAHSGYGYIELGRSAARQDGIEVPYWLNFDVVAHEMGHAILFSQLPGPTAQQQTREYSAFHETGSDIIAIIAAMHSEKLLWHVLDTSSGDIYGFNEINRLGEISNIEQIRLACNDLTIEDVIDNSGIHGYSLPLSGAIFDVLALYYLLFLERRGAIPLEVCDELIGRDTIADVFPRLHHVFEEMYDPNKQAFFDALCNARDLAGRLFASAILRLDSNGMTYLDVANAFLAANMHVTGGDAQEELAEVFLWRGIGSRYVTV